jgi:hypothetical protein
MNMSAGFRRTAPVGGLPICRIAEWNPSPKFVDGRRHVECRLEGTEDGT